MPPKCYPSRMVHLRVLSYLPASCQAGAVCSTYCVSSVLRRQREYWTYYSISSSELPGNNKKMRRYVDLLVAGWSPESNMRQPASTVQYCMHSSDLNINITIGAMQKVYAALLNTLGAMQDIYAVLLNKVGAPFHNASSLLLPNNISWLKVTMKSWSEKHFSGESNNSL